MKKNIALILPALFLGACATSNNSIPEDWVDITADREQRAEYWTPTVRPEPTYPVNAAMAGRSGCVDMSFFITPDGEAVGVEVLHAFPGNTFIQSAKNALSLWRWVPTDTNAERQAVKTTVQLDFMVEGGSNFEAAKAACEKEGSSIFAAMK